MTGVAQHIDWSAITPPLLLACTALVVLLVDAFVSPRARGRDLLPATLTVVGILAAAQARVQQLSR